MGKKKKKIKELEERIRALEEFKEFLLQEKISELRSQLIKAGFEIEEAHNVCPPTVTTKNENYPAYC